MGPEASWAWEAEEVALGGSSLVYPCLSLLFSLTPRPSDILKNLGKGLENQ